MTDGSAAARPLRRLTLPRPQRPRWVVFSDLDETYLAHGMDAPGRQALRALEAFLLEECVPRGLLFGWVTGSPLRSVLGKVERFGLSVLPHFVAGALGTELHLFSGEGVPQEVPAWRERVEAAGFSLARVEALAGELAREGLALSPQADILQARHKQSYHLRGRSPAEDAAALARIRAAAEASGLGVNVSRCNPRTGDPGDSYDVDFLSRAGGKRQAVDFLLAHCGLGPEQALAFGDSGNDLEMLRHVRHGYLVANATAEARLQHPHVAPAPHAGGILAVLQRLTA